MICLLLPHIVRSYHCAELAPEEETASACIRLSQSTDSHLTRVRLPLLPHMLNALQIIQQQLSDVGLSHQGLHVLLSLARRAVASVELRLRNGDVRALAYPVCFFCRFDIHISKYPEAFSVG